MSRSVYRWGAALALCLMCSWLGAASASAAEFPFQLDPALSLTADCSTSALDPIADPSCPYPPPPGGPSERFNEPRSVAIDSYGNEYVATYAINGAKGRIEVFDDEGHFITELSDPFGPLSLAVDSKGNLYVNEQIIGGPSEVVRYAPTVYEPEAGKIAYGSPRVVLTSNRFSSNGLAIDRSNDQLFVAQGSLISKYGSAAEGNKLLDTIEPGNLSWSSWVAVDAQRRRLYASSCREAGINDCVIRVFETDAPYAELEELDGSDVPAGKFVSTKGWLSIAVDEETGHFFVDDLENSKNVYEFNEDYEFVSKLNVTAFQGGNALQIAVSNGENAGGDAFNRHYLFVPVLLAAGRVLAFEPPDVRAPEVLELTAANIGETEAELQATIAPNGGGTEYVFEYVAQAGFEEEGFANAIVAGEGTIPAASLSAQVSAIIEGLAPASSYHFRLQAKNEAGEALAEGAFTTYSDALTTNGCSNQGLRTGASAALPDCRAYELVTPPDTNGRPPRGAGTEADRFGTVESSPQGGALSFEIFGGALPGSEATGGFHGDLYRAERGSSSWSTSLTGPTSTQATKPQPGSTSTDQGYFFWVAGGEGSAVIEGVTARYVRYPDGHSELIGRGSIGTDPEATGRLITENGTHIIFETDPVGATPTVQLEPNAPPSGTEVVYDRTADEVTHVVSLLPGDVTPAANENANYLNASADGNGIAFEIKGTLYLRKDNAVTYEIGTGVTFAGVSEGGKRIFYVEGGDLLAFDTETEEVVPFSETGDVTPVNVAPGGTRAYFVSPSVLGEESPNGALAQAGKENLYLSEEGAISFVGTVTALDVEGEANPLEDQINGLGLWADALARRKPGLDSSRLTPNGSVLLFQARASLDGQDTGGSPQIYRYDSAANRLRCLSCIPTGVPQGGDASLMSFAVASNDPPFSTFGYVPNLRADGKRAFFESDEALVSGDTDEVRDVYEWEAEGVGSCARADGCIYPISSGHSASDNFLYGHSDSGDDVFFTTADSLTGFDAGGTVSIYDARVNGGFPEPHPEACAESDSCKGPASSGPPIQAPTSEGLGRIAEPKPSPPKQCPKGRRKVKRDGKVRCVKKHRKHHRKAGTKKGAAR